MTTKPQRVQRRRAKGWRMPPNTIYVGRPTRWGNPWPVGSVVPCGITGDEDSSYDGAAAVITPAVAVALYREALLHPGLVGPRPGTLVGLCINAADVVRELRGRDLACWCPLEDEHGNHVPCHGDVLLEIANREVPA